MTGAKFCFPPHPHHRIRLPRRRRAARPDGQPGRAHCRRRGPAPKGSRPRGRRTSRRCYSTRSKLWIATPKADALVYELYGLTDDEIAIVEAGEASQSSYQAIDQFAATGYNDYREIRTEEQAMHTLAIEYPPEVLWALQQEPEEFEDDARLLLAVKLYEGGRLSTGMAAKLAGIPRSAFIFLLGRYRLSPFGQSPDDLEDDLANARRASYPQ